MESGGVQVLMTALPGQRIAEGKEPEDGSVLAYRKNGDECLFASWEADPVEGSDLERGRGMVWIPIGEFSPEPDSIRPPEIVEEPTGEEGTTERDPGHGPMGGRTSGSLRRRPVAEG